MAPGRVGKSWGGWFLSDTTKVSWGTMAGPTPLRSSRDCTSVLSCMDLCHFIQDVISPYSVTASLILRPSGDGNRKGRALGARKNCLSGLTSPYLASSYSLSSTCQSPQFLECVTLRQGHVLVFQGPHHSTLGLREDFAHSRGLAILLARRWGPWEEPVTLACVGKG